MRAGEFSRFFAWAVTFALLVVGLSMFVLGVPFLICGVVGLVYLARRPPRWPGLLGAPAGVGSIVVLWGLVLSQSADYETEGIGLIGGGLVLATVPLLLFRRAAATAPLARERGSMTLVRLGGRPHRSGLAIRRFPVWFALALFIVPSAFLWVYGNQGKLSSQGEFACYEAFRGVDEGAEITDEPSVWPPGGKCAYHAADGTVTIRSRTLPWPEWIVLAVLAVLAGACAWAYVTMLRSAAPA